MPPSTIGCWLLQVDLLEQESAALKDEDRQMSRLLADMAGQRDRSAPGLQGHHVETYSCPNHLRMVYGRGRYLTLSAAKLCACMHACRISRQVAVQHNKLAAAASAAKLRSRQEEELKSMVVEQERRAAEFEKLFDLVRCCAAAGHCRSSCYSLQCYSQREAMPVCPALFPALHNGL